MAKNELGVDMEAGGEGRRKSGASGELEGGDCGAPVGVIEHTSRPEEEKQPRQAQSFCSILFPYRQMRLQNERRNEPVEGRTCSPDSFPAWRV